MGHAGLEADTGSQRRLFKNQRHHSPGQKRLANACRTLVLEVFGQNKDAQDLFFGEIGDF